MGNGCGGTERVVNKEEEERLKRELEEKREALRENKVLLLGTGNSGKSTLFKQLKIIYGNGLDIHHRGKYLQSAVVHQMASLITAYRQRYSEEKMEEKVRKSADLIESMKVDDKITEEVIMSIETLWADPLIKQTHEYCNTLSVSRSSSFFFDEIRRVMAEDYHATEKDLLLIRIKTTGLNIIKCDIDNNPFKFTDMAGNRSERVKWIHAVYLARTMVYVASMIDYDQNLHEDESANAMCESLDLFSELLKCRYFKTMDTILLLSKDDLFKQKIEDTNVKKDMDDPSALPPNLLRRWFDDYDGRDYDYEDGRMFILHKFKSMNPWSKAEKPIFHHFTCATDTNHVRKVFDDIQNQVVMARLKRTGLL